MFGRSSKPIKVQIFAKSDLGKTRDHNEDCFLVADLTRGERSLQPTLREQEVGERGALLVVADGMGGAAAGELASQMATDTIYDQMQTMWGAEKELTPQRAPQHHSPGAGPGSQGEGGLDPPGAPPRRRPRAVLRRPLGPGEEGRDRRDRRPFERPLAGVRPADRASQSARWPGQYHGDRGPVRRRRSPSSRCARGGWASDLPAHRYGDEHRATRSEERRVGKECRSRW